jgi:heavy metal translocating P-type ATPase
MLAERPTPQDSATPTGGIAPTEKGQSTLPPGRRFGLLRRKPLVNILSETAKPSGPPDRTNDVRVSMAAVGIATAALLVPPLGIATVPLLLYSSRGILKFGVKSFLDGRPNTSTLVAVVVLAALVTQYYLFAAIAAVVSQYSYIVSDRVKSSARSGMIDIFSQRPKTVWIPYSDGESGEPTAVEVPIETVQEGDLVVVHTGEVIPIDGVVVEGLASVDQHILTGEAQPADKDAGDGVFASTVVMSGKIVIRVDKTGDATTVAQIGRILSRTLEFKADRQLKADDWANSTVIPTMFLSAAMLPVLGVAGGMAVINSHYKKRMSLAAPISILNYFRILSDQYILVKDGRTLDAIAEVDTVVFDKTGTLTVAQPTVGTIYTYGDADENTVLALAATAEDKQTHPIALAILEEAEQRQLKLMPPEDAAYQVGYGLTVRVQGVAVRVGSLRFMENEHLQVPDALQAQQDVSHEAGHSLVVVARDAQIIGAIELVPTIRPEAPAIVNWLKQNGIKETYIISGDHTTPTAKLAAQLGIDHYFAEVLPQDKAAIIEQLQASGRMVAYIGDGINDSIALKQAAVSISISGASAIAVDTAQVILMREDLQALTALFAYGREYDQNLRNMFRYMMITPMLVSLAFLPFPGINLWVSLIATVYSLSGSVAYAMIPMWRYQWQQKRALGAGDTEAEPMHQLTS